ncbi:LacI family transcriptional regulator [Oceanotoga sp. DSM 15011]|uniref:DNA-binding LacI/PurR family transcriptional regulator n=1 Tax=Oceanotoga teriensis TaxID=515440 RepID=A0AA45C6J5_9BACT|nr:MULTISPECIES: LacI family DNA-binding transcriptional regulator [Oceanotoga]MDN5341999.1 hypothetical protein [Oceanotoga sp.]PWJ92087.1 DNA-binding LacI/PurR family transcriptional regulator [Oceanotoga teriensis]UYO98963.1 LacI family transcriptional regulator [Oceanotoga sp. DSM 15011]
MINMKYIAKKAGVSPSTVSRAISNPNMVNEKTRNKILKIVDEYNFIPSSNARALKGKNTNIILFSFGDDINSIVKSKFYQVLLGKIQEKYEQNNYNLIMSLHVKQSEINSIKKLNSANIIDLTILASPEKKDKRIFELNKLEKKYLVLGNPKMDFDFNYIDFDNNYGGKLAFKYLKKFNPKKYLILGMKKNYDVISKRIDGFLSESNKDDNIEVITEIDPKNVKKYLKNTKIEKNTAIFCLCDEMAVETSKILLEKNFLFDKDFFCLGYDGLIDTFEYKNKEYKMKSIYQNIDLYIQNIYDASIDIINENKKVNKLIYPEMIL